MEISVEGLSLALKILIVAIPVATLLLILAFIRWSRVVSKRTAMVTGIVLGVFLAPVWIPSIVVLVVAGLLAVGVIYLAMAIAVWIVAWIPIFFLADAVRRGHSKLRSALHQWVFSN